MGLSKRFTFPGNLTLKEASYAVIAGGEREGHPNTDVGCWGYGEGVGAEMALKYADIVLPWPLSPFEGKIHTQAQNK